MISAGPVYRHAIPEWGQGFDFQTGTAASPKVCHEMTAGYFCLPLRDAMATESWHAQQWESRVEPGPLTKSACNKRPSCGPMGTQSLSSPRKLRWNLRFHLQRVLRNNRYIPIKRKNSGELN